MSHILGKHNSYQGCGVDEFTGDSDSDSDSDHPESTPTPTPESNPALYRLTLAGKDILVIFHDTPRHTEGWYNPRAVPPLIELELRGKNERAARHQTKRLV